MAQSENVLTSFIAWKQPWIATTTPQEVLPKNLARIRYCIQNDTDILYVALGSVASPLNYTYRLPRYAILEDFFQGEISIVTASGTALCFVTEEV